jgi:hypothetical protein
MQLTNPKRNNSGIASIYRVEQVRQNLGDGGFR